MVNFSSLLLLLSVPMALGAPAKRDSSLGGVVQLTAIEFTVEDFHHWAATSQIGDSLYLNNGTIYTRLEPPKDQPREIQKREPGGGICATTYHSETNVLQTGIWWKPWERVGPCNCCGLSDQTCSVSLSGSHTTGWSISVGLDGGVATEAKNSINGNAGLNFGFSWSESWTSSTTQICPAGPHSSSSLWLQQGMGWSNVQTRKGTSDTCTHFVTWDGWTNGHIDFPLGGSDDWGVNVKRGCSTGSASGCNCA